ncbi:MAG: ABC transporter permease subunit [Alicyclobacillus sp.]|nr:ABC transporter permease subunit [Alicyclobacillus sp.]
MHQQQGPGHLHPGSSAADGKNIHPSTIWPAFRTAASWCFAFLLIVALTAFRGSSQNISFQEHMWLMPTWSDFLQAFLTALSAPVHLFSPAGADDIARFRHYLPVTLFYVLFAYIGSYLFGTLKGLGDVFWRRRRGFRIFHGVAWVLDAIPMFGVVVLLELGTLYGEMYIKGDPLHMIPDRTFIGGDLIPAIILMWPPMMYLSRVIAVALRDELSERYVLTARSKGLVDKQILRRHVMRNLVPKLLNEMGTVFTIILSSLLALEYLAFRWGAAFDMYVAMGHGQLGEKSLYVNPLPFDTQLVMSYLMFFMLLTVLARILAWWLQKRWRLVHHV